MSFLNLNTTRMCNAKCRFCIVYETLNRPELNMTDEQVYEAMRRSRAEGATHAGYSGGEPSIDPRILDFVRYAKQIGFTHQSMVTNGIRFRKREFCEAILEAGLDSIDFSIHGHTDELHDTLVDRRGALEAIRQACAHLRELQKTRKFYMSATIVVTRDNHPFLPEICRFLDSLGIEGKRLKYAYEGNLTLEMVVEQVAPYEEVVVSLQRAFDYLMTQPGGFSVTHVPLCLLGEYAIFSEDFERREAVMAFRTHLARGDASQHYRTDGDECSRCVLAAVCTRLDAGYQKFHGRPQLRPFETEGEVETMFEAAARRFPNAANYVRQRREAFQRSRELTPPVEETIPL